MNRACLLVIAPLLGAAAIAGDITPPPGAPSSSMKTLQQVEPRRPINASTAPGDADSVFKIAQPGSYYLEADILVSTNEHAIEVVASDVTIDLAGFTISSIGLGTQKAGVAATVLGLTNVEVRNGVIRGFGGNGAAIDFNENSGDANVTGGSARHLRISDCSVGVNAGASFTVADCVLNAVGTGVAGWGRLVVERTQIRGADFYGVASANAHTTVRDSVIEDTGNAGILMTDGLVERVVIEDTDEAGISCFGATIRDCDIRDTGYDAIEAGSASLVENNRVSGFLGSGISAGLGSRVVGNDVFGAVVSPAGVQRGIFAYQGSAHIEDNTIFGVDTGIQANTGRCVIIRNSMTNTSVSISTTGNHTVGPISFAAGTISTTSPWANFLMNY